MTCLLMKLKLRRLLGYHKSIGRPKMKYTMHLRTHDLHTIPYQLVLTFISHIDYVRIK